MTDAELVQAVYDRVHLTPSGIEGLAIGDVVGGRVVKAMSLEVQSNGEMCIGVECEIIGVTHGPGLLN